MSEINWTDDRSVIFVQVDGLFFEDTTQVFRPMQAFLENAPIFEGRRLISGDKTIFTYVMRYMRTHQLGLPANFSDYAALINDAKRYGLNDLANLVYKSNKYIEQGKHKKD